MDQQTNSHGSKIPTAPEAMLAIEQQFIESAKVGALDEGLADALAEAIANGTNGDVFRLLAFARGCHSAAEIYRARGDDFADLLHAMGQDLLAQAVDLLAVYAALDVHLSGTVRH